jgi:hypothetical protein
VWFRIGQTVPPNWTPKHAPVSLRASINCLLTFTHHLDDVTEHSFLTRRLQQTISTATPQAKYLLVIKRVIYGNTPSHFPYFLPSSEFKNLDRKLRKSDIARLLWSKGRNHCYLLLSLVFHKLSAAIVPSVYVCMNRVPDTLISYRLCVTLCITIYRDVMPFVTIQFCLYCKALYRLLALYWCKVFAVS